MANTIREKELKTSWPFTIGTTAGTTSQTGVVMSLTPTVKSLVPDRLKKGLHG